VKLFWQVFVKDAIIFHPCGCTVGNDATQEAEKGVHQNTGNMQVNLPSWSEV